MDFLNERAVDHIVILTGAGVSAESGLATFRDNGGLWEKHDPMEIATPEAFARDPELVFRFYNARRAQLAEVEPNPAHRAIARLQAEFSGTVTVVTQNVDDLHERGGSVQVCHMHGELLSRRCNGCGASWREHGDFDGASRCSQCGLTGKLRPDIVWFGEIPMYMDQISTWLARSDLFVAIGTSGVVYPAAGFVREAAHYGALTVEINREESDVTSQFEHHLQGLAGEVVPTLVDKLLVAGGS